jgi:pimeloyl-ACP methyl ester carboxylesterase
VESKSYKAIRFLVLVSMCSAANAAVVIPIEAPGKATFASKDPTLTMLFEPEQPAKATVFFIPGGDGTTPIKEGMTYTTHPWTVGVLLPLTKAGYNVVTISNPTAIDARSGQPGGDRLDRIESAVKYYRDKLKVPVILLGHSNGTAAVHEFANRSEENRQSIAGVVISAGRQEYKLNTEVKFPILIVHHKLDACDTTSYSSATLRYESYKEMKLAVKFVTIEGGEGGGQPCYAGHHMYYKAYQEVADALIANLPK